MRNRPTLLTALALLLCVLAVFSDLWSVEPGTLLTRGDDAVDHFAPWLEFGFSELRAGRLPLWNPHQFAGTPFFGAFESALLYPPNWLHLALPTTTAINAGLILHVFLGGFFASLWCRRLGQSPSAAALAGIVFMLSGPFYLRVNAGHLPLLASMAWTPAIFWSLESAWKNPAQRWRLAGMLFICLQILSGNPQCLYYTALAVAFYTMIGLIQKERTGGDALVPAGMYLGGAALACVQLLTGLDAASESVRGGGVYYDFAASFSLPPENLLTGLVPRLFGDRVNFPYFGRWYFWETCLFIGSTGWLLAGYGLAGGEPKRRRALGLLATSALVLALGPLTPLHELFYHLLPGFGMFRGTAKFSFLSSLALAALIGLGFDRLRAAASPPRAWILISAAVSFGLWLAGSWLSGLGPRAVASAQSALSALHSTRQTFLQPDFYTSAASAATAHAGSELKFTSAFLAAFACLLFLSKRIPRAPLGLALLLSGEMILFAAGSRSSRTLDTPPQETSIRDPNNKSDEARILLDPVKFPNAAMRRGQEDAWGYGSFVLRRYAEYIAASQGLDPDKASQYQAITGRPPALSLVRLTDDPLPRLSLVQGYAVKSGRDEILRSLLEPRFNPRKTVLLESEPDKKPVPGGRGGRVTLLRKSTDDLEIEAELVDPAILLITDAYGKGWRASSVIDNPPQDAYTLLPADHAFRAVPLAAGRHHLLIEYSPLSFRIGFWISLLAWGVYLMAWAWELR